MQTEIVLTAAPAFDYNGDRLPSKFDAVIDGRTIVRATRQPLLDGARMLLTEGVDPRSTVIMKHAGSETADAVAECLRARIGDAARLTVKEGPHGPVFTRWKAQETPPDRPPMRRTSSEART